VKRAGSPLCTTQQRLDHATRLKFPEAIKQLAFKGRNLNIACFDFIQGKLRKKPRIDEAMQCDAMRG